jgi:hypothetical protein
MNGRRAAAGDRYHEPVEGLVPYRLLALRVIRLAVQDLLTNGRSLSERDSARAFLLGSPMLTHWCTLAELDPVAIGEQVSGLLAHTPTRHTARRH